MKTIMKAAFGNGTYELNDEGNLELVQDQSNQYPIVIGQIAHFHGYGNERERLAVYKIEKDERWGSTYYHLLNLDKPKLSKHEGLRPLETRKGTPIGIYYKQGDIATQEEIEEVLPMALAYEQREADKRAAASKEQEEKAAIAKKWWADNTPKWAKAYIVAELKKDESDSMSDYFHASTSKTLLLAWSASDRLNFKEMREACLQAPKEIENLSELKEDRYHRILGNYYHGWTIKKYRIGGFNGYNDSFVADPENVRIKSGHHYNIAEPTAQPTGDKIALCKLNSAKGGIELYFNNKPAQAVLDDLKAKSWRWSKFNKCWYRLDNPIARQQAAKYADVPQEEVNHDEALVQAQEDAASDNWAQANNI